MQKCLQGTFVVEGFEMENWLDVLGGDSEWRNGKYAKIYLECIYEFFENTV